MRRARSAGGSATWPGGRGMRRERPSSQHSAVSLQLKDEASKQTGHRQGWVIIYLTDGPSGVSLGGGAMNRYRAWWTLPVHGISMRRLNDFRFYELGTRLQPLAEIANETLYKERFFELFLARAAVEDLFNYIPVQFCRGAATELVQAITEVVPEDWKDALGGNMDAEIGYRSHTIRTAKEAFEHVLSAELSSVGTYFLTQQGIYNTSDLVERSEMAFSEETQKVISDEAKQDFRQGGRCLAFELPTASGFHTMRATEAVLRQYHRLVTGLPSSARSPEMAQCINELRAKGEDPKLMSILDSIRDLHRNPQMHPEAFLSMDEALRLFDIAKSAINGMADKVATLQKAAAKNALSVKAAATAVSQLMVIAPPPNP
jgi:hypothetical protein